eukprot:5927013-Prymnesium_polylepis.1
MAIEPARRETAAFDLTWRALDQLAAPAHASARYAMTNAMMTHPHQTREASVEKLPSSDSFSQTWFAANRCEVRYGNRT